MVNLHNAAFLTIVSCILLAGRLHIRIVSSNICQETFVMKQGHRFSKEFLRNQSPVLQDG